MSNCAASTFRRSAMTSPDLTESVHPDRPSDSVVSAAPDTFEPGDTFTYTSVTQGYLVVWTRGDDGTWHANDEAVTERGSESDQGIREAMDMGDDWIYTPAGGPDAV